MPKGMKLRSPLRATDIAAPAPGFSLEEHMRGRNAALVEPLPLEDFVGYGEWFQARAVPNLDRRLVARVEPAANGYRVVAASGEALYSRRVVVATGLASHAFRPPAFAHAPAELVSHTCDYAGFDGFRGKRVAVVGRGQTACETAALLTEAGAQVELICRGPIRWLGAGGRPSGWRKAIRGRVSSLLRSPSAVGPFPLSWLVEAPGLVRLMPDDMRDSFNAAALRAAAAGWLWPRFGEVRIMSEVEIVGVAVKGRGVEIKFDRGGSAAFDRVVLATGYRYDVANLAVLAPELRAAIARRSGSPVLSAGFETSAPGLHIVGAGAVSSLGPLMRFIAGTPFTAKSVARAILNARGASRAELPDPVEFDLTA